MFVMSIMSIFLPCPKCVEVLVVNQPTIMVKGEKYYPVYFLKLEDVSSFKVPYLFRPSLSSGDISHHMLIVREI